MAANDSKARLRVVDLVTKLLEYVRDGKRDANHVARVLQEVKDNPNFLQRLFPETAPSQPLIIKSRLKHVLKEWEVFYFEVFGMRVDLSDFKVPRPRSGFERLIVVAQGLTPQKIVETLKKYQVSVAQYWRNLNELVSIRKTYKTYAVWVRDRREPDAELGGKNPEQLEVEGIKTTTLEESLLFHLKYFRETGHHLDVEHFNICAGSCDNDGYTAAISWNRVTSTAITIDKCNWRVSGGGNIRARQVIY